MKTETLKRIFVTATLCLILWAAFKFVFPFALPFILAWAVAACLQPAVKLMAKRFGVSRRPVAGVFVTVTVLGLGATAFLLVSRFVSELGGVLAMLTENADGGISGFFDDVNELLQKLPFASAFGENIATAAESALVNMLSQITTAIPSMAASVLGALPGAFLFAVIIIMASYYFASDYDGIKEKIYNAMPVSVRLRWNVFKERLSGAGVQYLRACVALAFITFSELLVGFLVLEIPYAFTLAALIALVDMLPILGAGTALIPWAVWEWATGDRYYAIGLLIILTVVTVVRRFAEPRIISSGIGLSPITTLISMYIGFKLFGLGGLFLAPLVAVLILNALPDDTAAFLGMKRNEGGGERTGKRKARKGGI